MIFLPPLKNLKILNLHDICSKNARILHNNCPKKYFPELLPSPTPTMRSTGNTWQCPAWWPPVAWVETPDTFFAICRPKFTKLSIHKCGSDRSLQRRFVAFRRYQRSSREVVGNSAKKFLILLDRQSFPIWGGGEFPQMSDWISWIWVTIENVAEFFDDRSRYFVLIN